MRRFALEETSSTILIPGNSLLHMLTVKDQPQCLTCVGRHLDADGWLVLHIANPDAAVLARNPGQRSGIPDQIATPRGKSASRKLQAVMLQPKSATLGGISRLPMPLTSAVIDYRLRVIVLEELLLLFEATGFQLVALW